MPSSLPQPQGNRKPEPDTTDRRFLGEWYRRTGQKPAPGDLAAIRRLIRVGLGSGILPDDTLSGLVADHQTEPKSLAALADDFEQDLPEQKREHLQILDSLRLSERIAVAGLFVNEDGHLRPPKDEGLTALQQSALRHYQRVQTKRVFEAQKKPKDAEGKPRKSKTITIPDFIDNESGLTDRAKRFLADVHYLSKVSPCWKTDLAFAADYGTTEGALNQLARRLVKSGHLLTQPNKLDARKRTLKLNYARFKHYKAPRSVGSEPTPRMASAYDPSDDALRDVGRQPTPRRVIDAQEQAQPVGNKGGYANPAAAESSGSRQNKTKETDNNNKAASRQAPGGAVVVVGSASQSGASPPDPCGEEEGKTRITANSGNRNLKSDAIPTSRNNGGNVINDNQDRDRTNGAPRHASRNGMPPGGNQSQWRRAAAPAARSATADQTLTAANAPQAQVADHSTTSRVIAFLTLAHKERFKSSLPVIEAGRSALARFCAEHENLSVPAICLVTLMAWEMIGYTDPENGFKYPHCQRSRKLEHLFRFNEEKDTFDAWEAVCESVQAQDIADENAPWLVARMKKVSKLPAESINQFFARELDNHTLEKAPDPNLPAPETIGDSIRDFEGFLRGKEGVPVAWLEGMFHHLLKHEPKLEKLSAGQRQFLFGWWRERVKYRPVHLKGYRGLDDHFEWLDAAEGLEGEVVQRALAHIKQQFKAHAESNVLEDHVTDPSFMGNAILCLRRAGIIKKVERS